MKSNVTKVLELLYSAGQDVSQLQRALQDATLLVNEMDSNMGELSEDELSALSGMKNRGISIEDAVQFAELWSRLASEAGEGGEDLFELAENSIRQWGAVEDLGYSDSSDIETLMDEHTDYEQWRSEVMGALDEYQDDPRLAGLASNEEADGAVHQINILADNNNSSSKVLDAIKALISALEEEQVIGSGNARKEGV
jgi:hypothetical protein